jgi:putative transposase
MQLVEQHVIDPQDARYDAIDAAAFASKNLYNAANYLVRQTFIHTGVWLRYETVYHQMKTHDAYRALPAKVSQQVMKVLDKNWKGYMEACKAWQADPSKFLGHPRLPKYKDKRSGRNILVYTIQAISRNGLKRGVIQPSGLPIEIETKQTNVDCVRIVPRNGYYVVEVVYEQETRHAPVDPSLYAAIDIGLNNLATLTSNKAGFVPRLVNGRPLKSVNQFYNKRRAELQSKVKSKACTARIERMTNKRTRKLDHYLHTASRRLVDLLVDERIGTLVIGKNANWKQEANMGKRNNQNFVSIPHARFIDMLTYKCQLVGIAVMVTEESYSSKCSFLDMEPIGKHETYLGKRVRRGMFRSAEGYRYNADINGSYNILRKVAPDAFAQGSRGCIVHPSPFVAER